ncbi:hypothetical protein CPter291_0038 [Collimonas pratensis]|uniref:Uncharacterized protein n=1 Tax=Collimonas pratensis TaxID=279113 RepID=A0A127PXV3_9BURK|nr:hypothetical protein CPter91_0025 [Collimonas pratensis]AMP12334.1 hypothetical protein CPter291_0038 [Collimonas pratensis]
MNCQQQNIILTIFCVEMLIDKNHIQSYSLAALIAKKKYL